MKNSVMSVGDTRCSSVSREIWNNLVLPRPLPSHKVIFEMLVHSTSHFRHFRVIKATRANFPPLGIGYLLLYGMTNYPNPGAENWEFWTIYKQKPCDQVINLIPTSSIKCKFLFSYTQKVHITWTSSNKENINFRQHLSQKPALPYQGKFNLHLRSFLSVNED